MTMFPATAARAASAALLAPPASAALLAPPASAVLLAPPASAVLLALLVGCAASVAPVDRNVPGAWRIEQARTEPMLDKRLARLDFGADGRLTGHTSCNRLSAPYTLAGDKVDIGRVVTTRMACPRLQMEQEDRVLTALELARTARVRPDGLLELRDEDGRGVLRATRWRDE